MTGFVGKKSNNVVKKAWNAHMNRRNHVRVGERRHSRTGDEWKGLPGISTHPIEQKMADSIRAKEDSQMICRARTEIQERRMDRQN
jgi:hypothetical protein